QDHQFPNANRRKPFFVCRILKCSPEARHHFLRLEQTPNPNVRVEKEFHELRTFQSFSSLAGETMSPTMRPVPAMEPSHCFFSAFGEGGTTSATGSPNLVTRMGLRVLRTRSRSARQVALNLEMAISSITQVFTIVRDHSQTFGMWALGSTHPSTKGQDGKLRYTERRPPIARTTFRFRCKEKLGNEPHVNRESKFRTD